MARRSNRGYRNAEFNGGWPAYVPVARRRAQAAALVRALEKEGQQLAPIFVDGREIVTTWWGRAWCKNIERYSDFASRLPRGRTYTRNGSIIDLQIRPGRVDARVSGSTIYRIEIEISPLPAKRWKALVAACTGQIGSVIDLLQGRVSDGILEVLVDPEHGLFPDPSQIRLSCSCPDWAGLCKHLAATLYGIGVRLDALPDLFFTLRQVDQAELISAAPTLPTSAPDAVTLSSGDLGALFGIDIEGEASVLPQENSAGAGDPGRPAPSRPAPRTRKKPPIKKKRPAAKKVPKRKRAADNRSAGSAPEKKPRKTARARASRPMSPRSEVTAADLVARGIPRTTFQNWITSGVLLRTRRRGVYRTTAQTEPRIQAALARLRG